VDRRLQIVLLGILCAACLGAYLFTLSRLTRNRYTQRVYEICFELGVTATWLSEYGKRLEATDGLEASSDASLPDRYRIRTCDPETVDPLDAPVADLQAGEEVIAILEDGTPCGYLFLSVDTTHEIQPLEQQLAFDGAYIRRVYVAPEYRNQGLGSAMLEFALSRSVERGARRATALVALDNTPSRKLFERYGFDVERTHRYVRAGSLVHRSVGEP
jgi:ribosomal protein S18 acetylase RimI-like enzyme